MHRVDRALDPLPMAAAQQALPAVPPQAQQVGLPGADDPALGPREPQELGGGVDARQHRPSLNPIETPFSPTDPDLWTTGTAWWVVPRSRGTTHHAVGRDQPAVRLTAEVTARREAVTMLASMPTPQATTLFSPSPISHST